MNDISLSRPIATALALAAHAHDADRFFTKKVLLTGEQPVLSTPNGHDTFLASLRLLTRTTTRLYVAVPDSMPSLLEEVTRIIVAFGDSLPTPQLVPMSSSPDDYEAILSVGATGHADGKWTVVNSNGWVARVSSRSSISADCGQWNPIGALAAASLGTAEIFKRLIRLKPARGEAFDRLSFSFYTYTETDDPGPNLPDELNIDAVLVGVGAIGNAIVYLLMSLPVRGRLAIADRQKFGAENLGTCILIGSAEVGESKALFAKRLLEATTGLSVEAFEEEAAKFLARFGGELPFPPLVLNALDNVPTRRAVQEKLWPNFLIDGAIGETSCEATLHPWGPDSSCILCDFEETPVSAEEIQKRATGLSADRLADPDSVITEEDVASAPADKKDFLADRIGKPVCSVVSEATARQLSLDALPDHFQPSVPFVACLSACMVVGEIIRYQRGDAPPAETGFQFDVFVGPRRGIMKAHRRKPTCICVQRRSNIEQLRKKRGLA